MPVEEAGDALKDAAPDEYVESYWTPERMDAAEPADMPEASEDELRDQESQGSAGGDASTAPEERTEPVAPSQEAVEQAAAALADGQAQQAAASDASEGQPSEAAAPPVTNFSVTNGKLFFNLAGESYVCSGSAINTPTGRAVITAGHCLYDRGVWATDVQFVPAYNGTSADRSPVGAWTSRVSRVFTKWKEDRDFTYDVGVVTLRDGGDAGGRIVDSVGGHGLSWNGSASYDVSIFGYPSNKVNPDGSLVMWACWGTTFGDGGIFTPARDSIVGCDFGKGSSGGAWLYRYSNDSGLGYVRSVMSTWDSDRQQNWGPHFTGRVKAMVDASNGDAG